jgi:carboxyl-terminal processing protease
MSQDSIQFNDSLMFETKLLKRKVYGGGGIMPDVFVPLDTTEITDYYSALVRSGNVNTFALDYVDKNRDALLSKYSTFNQFRDNFNTDKSFMKEFFDYVEKEREDSEALKFNEEEYEISKRLLQLRIKASMARDLWGYSEFFQIYNETNEILQKAIEVVESDDYDLLGIAD